MALNQKIINNLKVILGNNVEHNIVEYIYHMIIKKQKIITPFRYISTMKHEEDFEEFMENIVNKNNTAHINAYNGIKYAIFGDKLRKKNVLSFVPKQQNHTTKSEQIRQDNQHSSKKGKKKFKDINTFQEKKKQREGKKIKAYLLLIK